jgi:predicted phosphodiesterase
MRGGHLALPTKPLPDDVLREAVEAKAKCRTLKEAAALLNVSAGALHNRILRAAERGIHLVSPSPHQDQFSAYEAIHAPPPKPRISIRAETQYTPPEGQVYRVMGIGDAHEKPGRCKERFKWMARHAAETQPHAVVSIGDWASLDSLSTHEMPGSANDAARPAFHEELESLDESLGLFNREIEGAGLSLFHTHGNHEMRATRAANRQPKLNGDMPLRLDQTFIRYGWNVKPFGEFLELFGVDFVHCPLNVMGREMGGENVERNVANKSLRSLVFGHTHRAQVCNFTKVGQQRKISVVNLGTSMPYGTIEKYNGLSMTGWSWGFFDLRI